MQQLRNPYYLGDEQTLTETSGWADAWIFGKLLLRAERREEATAQFATALPPSQPPPQSVPRAREKCRQSGDADRGKAGWSFALAKLTPTKRSIGRCRITRARSMEPLLLLGRVELRDIVALGT
jgi:hypothetical protein